MAEGRIAVVGAGLAGLAASLELKQLGYTVEVFERSRLLGGKATSFKVDGIEVDNGQHVFLACCDEFISFVRRVCLLDPSEPTGEPPLYLQSRFEVLVLARDHNPVKLRAADLPAPLHLAPALLASRHLRVVGRLQVATALLLMRGSVFPGETFAEWLRRHRQGRLAWSGFWSPFVVPALNADMDQVAAEEAAFVIESAFLDQPDTARFGYATVPLGRIAESAVRRLDDLHLKTPVVGLEMEHSAGDRRIRLKGIRLQDRTIQGFDAVVLAIPPHRLKSLLAIPKDFGIFGLDQFRHAPIVDVHLWYDTTPGTILEPGFTFAALLDSPLQWVFEKPAPPGETYLCCSMSAAHRYVGWKAEDLACLCHRELLSVLPGLEQARLLRSAATRDREATFVPSVGLVRPGPATASPEVVLAGAWTDTGWPATMESAVRSGRRAAGVIHGASAA